MTFCVHGGGGVVMSFVLCGFLSLSPFLLMIMMTCSCFLCFLFCLKRPKSKERIVNAIKKDVKGIFSWGSSLISIFKCLVGLWFMIGLLRFMIKEKKIEFLVF